MHAQTDTKDDIRPEISRGQNLVITDDYVSYATTRDHHWNIPNAESRRLDQLFKAQYAKTNEMLRTFLEFEPQEQNFSKTTNPRPHHHE